MPVLKHLTRLSKFKSESSPTSILFTFIHTCDDRIVCQKFYYTLHNPRYEVYRGYIVFAFSVTMFVCWSVCKLFFLSKISQHLPYLGFLNLVQSLIVTYCLSVPFSAPIGASVFKYFCTPSGRVSILRNK